MLRASATRPLPSPHSPSPSSPPPTTTTKAYKWFNAVFILDLIPGMIACMILSQKIGNGKSVVLGNFITAFCEQGIRPVCGRRGRG